MAEIILPSLSEEAAKRLSELTGGATEIRPDFPGLSEEAAVEATQLTYGIDEFRARARLARARGEVPYGCVRKLASAEEAA